MTYDITLFSHTTRPRETLIGVKKIKTKIKGQLIAGVRQIQPPWAGMPSKQITRGLNESSFRYHKYDMENNVEEGQSPSARAAHHRGQLRLAVTPLLSPTLSLSDLVIRKNYGYFRAMLSPPLVNCMEASKVTNCDLRCHPHYYHTPCGTGGIYARCTKYFPLYCYHLPPLPPDITPR